MAAREDIQRPDASDIRSAAQFVLALVALVGVASVVTGPRPARVAATSVAVLVVPGAAVTGFVRMYDLMTELLVAVVLSIALAIAASQVLLMLRVRDVTPFFALATLISAATLGRHVLCARRERAAERYRRQIEALRQARLHAHPPRQPFRPNGRPVVPRSSPMPAATPPPDQPGTQ